MKIPKLLPREIEDCLNELVSRVAEVHLETGQADAVRIFVQDVSTEGFPAGDYEVVIRQTKPALHKRLSSLNNPWMRVFEK